MQKLVVLKLDGDLVEGVRATLEIGSEKHRAGMEVRGSLTANPALVTHYERWQSIYRSLDDFRIIPIGITLGGKRNERLNNCRLLEAQLSQQMNEWLNCNSFRPLKEKLLEQLTLDDTVRVLIKADDSWLRRLPWHLWDFFENYSKAEVALSALEYEILPSSKSLTSNGLVKILAILGNSEGISLETDRELLKQLPDAQTTFLIEPKRSQLNDELWQQEWDILFFAGHSSSQSDGKTGYVFINETDKLTIDELKYALKQAVRGGLQLAIFNSCDGLGLAHQLENLHIPQIIVMREPVPDKVAHEFLKNFLTNFSGGVPLYLAVRESREKLQGLEDEYPCAIWLPVICQHPAAVPPTWSELVNKQLAVDNLHPDKFAIHNQSLRRSLRSILSASLVVTGLVMGVRTLGLLQSWELKAFDSLMIIRPEEKPDARLLIITIDEADIQYQNRKKMKMRWSLSDSALAQLLNKLERYQPKIIGIDIYRDFSVEPDNAYLANRLKQDNRLIAVCKVSAAADGAPDGVLPPPEVSVQRLGFSDFVADDDEFARRQLLQLTPPLTSPCVAEFSLSLQIALHYLDAKGIKASFTQQGYLQLGNAVFKQLKPHSSGYQQVDASGYQVLLNYRSLQSPQNIAEQVPLRAILSDQINPNLAKLIKNRIVLIGVTAPSTVDLWKIPYSNRALPNQKQVPGVFVQAHMVSHILSAVLDRRPLFWWWSTSVETVWIWGWSLLGGILAWRIRQPLRLGIAGIIGLGLLLGICFGIFTLAGWIPLVPSALAFAIALAIIASRKQRYSFSGINKSQSESK